jgi:hypothetical protein
MIIEFLPEMLNSGLKYQHLGKSWYLRALKLDLLVILYQINYGLFGAAISYGKAFKLLNVRDFN